MPRLRTTMSQFALVAGRRRNHTETIACRVPSRRPFGAPEAHLYIMAEHAAADGADHGLCQIVMRELQLAFVAEEHRGAPAALAHAVRELNQIMWEECRALPAHRRLPLGVLALALEGDDAYLCQIATGQALVGRGLTCQLLPDLDHWRAVHLGMEPAPPSLGQVRHLEPQLYHVRLEPGDWIALCATNLARLIETETLNHLPGQPVERVTAHLCALAEDYGLPQTSGLAIKIIETPMPSATPAPLELAPFDPATAVRPAVAAAPRRAGLGSVLERLPRLTPLLHPATAIHAGAALEPARAPAAASAAPEPAVTTAQPASATQDTLPQNVVRLYASPPLAASEAAPPVEVGPETPPPAPEAARPARPATARWMDALAASLVLATDAMRGASAVVRPARPAPRRRAAPASAGRPRRAAPRRTAPVRPEPVYRASSGPGGAAAATIEGAGSAVWSFNWLSLPAWSSGLTPVMLALAAVAAALVLAAAVSSLAPGWLPVLLPGQGGVPAVVEQARVQREAAAQAASPEVARESLEQVQAMLAEAQASQRGTESPAAAQIAEEQVATRSALDDLTSTSRMGAVRPLADLSASGTPASAPKQLVVGEQGVFLLDPYTSTVYQIDAQGHAPTALLTKGWTIQRQKVGDLIGAAWRGDTLVVMDRTRAYTLDGPNNTWRVAPLAAGDIGVGAHAVSTYGKGLYVLDNANRQILKFAAGAYGNAPAHWLQEGDAVDLSSAIDIAIDGRIYALTSAGQVLSMMRGKLEQTLTIDVTPAIQNPVALVSPPDSDHLYIGDASGRIVKITKDGRFVRQYLLASDGTELANLSDLWIDEASGTMYAVAGNRVLSVAMPRATPMNGTGVHFH